MCVNLTNGHSRHIVAPPAHYAAKHSLITRQGSQAIREGYAQIFKRIYSSLGDGGHVFVADRTAHDHPGVFEHCMLLKEAGFVDVDVAWREKGWFVVGAKKPNYE